MGVYDRCGGDELGDVYFGADDLRQDYGGSGMRGYVTALLAVALLGAVIGMVSPEGDLKKYVRLLCGLCLLATLASPVMGVIEALSDGELLGGALGDGGEQSEDYEAVFEAALRSGSATVAADALTAELAKRFDLPDGSVSAAVILEQGEACRVRSVRVTLFPEAIFADPTEIIAYVNDTLGCPCEIVYE
ncbi:MAG: hypothetical protein E7668_04870 [Ruminococcaceae bacterium]|nr:hypothetical protein [Oscillospiraceae bacterium]